jgi:hypothetical protein
MFASVLAVAGLVVIDLPLASLIAQYFTPAPAAHPREENDEAFPGQQRFGEPEAAREREQRNEAMAREELGRLMRGDAGMPQDAMENLRNELRHAREVFEDINLRRRQTGAWRPGNIGIPLRRGRAPAVPGEP